MGSWCLPFRRQSRSDSDRSMAAGVQTREHQQECYPGRAVALEKIRLEKIVKQLKHKDREQRRVKHALGARAKPAERESGLNNEGQHCKCKSDPADRDEHLKIGVVPVR